MRAHGHAPDPSPQLAPVRLGDLPDRRRPEPDLRGHADREPRSRQPLRLRRVHDGVGGRPLSAAPDGERQRGALRAACPWARWPRRRSAPSSSRRCSARSTARRGVPAPDHVRPAPDPRGPDAPDLGAVSALRQRRSTRASAASPFRRIDLSDLQSVRDRRGRRGRRRPLGLRVPHPVRRRPARHVPEHAHGLGPRRQRQPRLRGGVQPSAASWPASAAPSWCPSRGLCSAWAWTPSSSPSSSSSSAGWGASRARSSARSWSGSCASSASRLFPEIELAVLYLMAAVVLLIRPAGLFGRA